MYEADVRYKGQGLTMPLAVDVARLEAEGLTGCVAWRCVDS